MMFIGNYQNHLSSSALCLSLSFSITAVRDQQPFSRVPHPSCSALG